MARKSPWQQFSDNFSSVYGTFQELGRGLETSRVMREKPEEEMVQEGPRNSYERATGKWNYGGKTYDEQLTPDMLRGLQYNRLGDVMAKYGDPTGAMAMRTSAANIETSRAQLEATNLSNELAGKQMNLLIENLTLQNKGMDWDNAMAEQMLMQAVEGWPIEKANKLLINFGKQIDNDRNFIKLDIEKATKGAMIELATLQNDNIKAGTENTIGNTNLTAANLDFALQTMDARVAQEALKELGLEYDNESKKYKVLLEEATLKNKITISGLKVEAAKIANINETIKGEGWKITNDGNLVQLGVDKATADSKIKLQGLQVDAQLQANINAALEGTGLVLNNRGKLVAAETAEALQDSDEAAREAENKAKMEESKTKSTAARLENNANLNLLEYSKIVKDGGNFTNKDGQKISNVEWLEENWTGDPKVKKLINTLKDDELTDIMREGVVMMTSVEAAITGKTSLDAVKDDLTKLIDDQDSIPGNVTIEQGEFGAVWLTETDAEGNKTSEIRGKDFEEFKQNLIKTMSPMRAVSIATANAQLRKLEAQVIELEKIGMSQADAEEAWVKHWSEIAQGREDFAEPPLSAEEIAAMKYTFFNDVIAKVKVTQTGIGKGNNNDDDDALWSSTELSAQH